MRYRITHHTTYRYITSDGNSVPIRLNPHILRLCPRNDGAQWLEHFEIAIAPTPTAQHYFLDTCGNTCLQITFDSPIEDWTIDTTSDVRTLRENPFNYLSTPWAVQLPIDYPSSLAHLLQPYLSMPIGTGVAAENSPDVVLFAQGVRQVANNNVGYFLTALVQKISEQFDYQQRLEGMPLPAEVTLQQRAGSCRDFTVLFMAACRAVGLAARFVSGYQEGDLESDQPNDLHAWAEVYIPGGGWRGFDPTLGLAVGDRHVAIAAAADPKQAAPVSGTLRSASQAKTLLESKILLRESLE
ncbi:MAG: transglutaminase family protein [Cyanobacteria bacterium J06649_5]